MKKFYQKIILAAMVLFTTSVAIAQVPATIDFEAVGTNWSWTIFENAGNEATLYAVEANPAVGGINTSANVARHTVNPTAQPWAGLWSNDMPDITVSNENCIVKVMVYKDVISNFGVKFENQDASVNFQRLVPNTVVNQWEELTFDFCSHIGSSVTRLVILPDFPTTRTAGSTNYWDNISFGAAAAPVQNAPTTTADSPTVDSSQVISMFSRAYTNVPVNTWRTAWSAATYSEVQVAGNPVKSYSGLNFVGIETTGANLINASGMTHFHVDIWTPDIATFRVKLVDFGANREWAGGDDVEHELSFTPTPRTWVRLDLPLSSFTGLVTRESIAQLIFSGTPTGGTVFIDNVFFYNSVPASIDNMERNELLIFPNPASEVLKVRSGQQMAEIEIINLMGQRVLQQQVNGLEASIVVSSLPNGKYIIRLTNENGAVSTHRFSKQ